MSVTDPTWPPMPYKSATWPDDWLRFEKENKGSARPSRLVAHAMVPYVAQMTSELPVAGGLGQIASNYLKELRDFLKDPDRSLDFPPGWTDSFVPDETSVDLIQWREVWPPVGASNPSNPPHLASWNLSRNQNQQLPATIIMVAAELPDTVSDVGGTRFGVRVPMLVEKATTDPLDDTVTVTIRSMTAEYPTVGELSWSTLGTIRGFSENAERLRTQEALIAQLTGETGTLFDQIGSAVLVLPKSLRLENFASSTDRHAFDDDKSVIIHATYKARGALDRFPHPLSYQVVSTIKLDTTQPSRTPFELLKTEVSSLVTHVGLGEALVFPQTPPGSIKPADPLHPDRPYDWALRRPTRTDEILDRFREIAVFEQDLTLGNQGFNVRLCPQYVPEDKKQLQNADKTKVVHLPANNKLPPRRNTFSALSAYFNSKDFFQLLADFGIQPPTFVVRAKTDLQIFYRYGITPGPGRDGKTVNAQVAFDCSETGAPERPAIRMNLALAEMSRWDRPLHADGKRTWAEPLGIAMDTRWMLHEFGHYLLAARIGKLEFDFAHSPGDAMAAIGCDPTSRLADRRNNVAESFRGITYPFVFSTRRHDRSPTLGWAWYGGLNRSIIDAPPTACDQTKGYLTEQILSSTLFRLYRALGGDTMAGNAPDTYVRERASFLTLFLLIRAIQGMAQSPSKAEMLELGLEDAGLLQAGSLSMVSHPLDNAAPALPADGWKGGLTHKTVRWAFETQGMFVPDGAQTVNGPGKPPAVDVYVQDQRPAFEMINGNRFSYGPGSYCPVSLDWSAGALWQARWPLTFGNRGPHQAKSCKLRVWVGIVGSAPADQWELAAQIDWTKVFSKNIPTLAANQSQRFTDPALDAAIAAAQGQAPALAAPMMLVLYELTCPNDRANTDPDATLGVKVVAAGDLPRTPRALTDLVANDNNLGLRVVRP